VPAQRLKPAQRLLLMPADTSEELSAQAFPLHASAALCVALQRGNADLAACGSQALRIAPVKILLDDATASTRHNHPASVTTTTKCRWAPLST